MVGGLALALRGARRDSTTVPRRWRRVGVVFRDPDDDELPANLDLAPRRELAAPELIRRHRLELPSGLDPARIPVIGNLPA